jgi:hypothetical protein
VQWLSEAGLRAGKEAIHVCSFDPATRAIVSGLALCEKTRFVDTGVPKYEQ